MFGYQVKTPEEFPVTRSLALAIDLQNAHSIEKACRLFHLVKRLSTFSRPTFHGILVGCIRTNPTGVVLSLNTVSFISDSKLNTLIRLIGGTAKRNNAIRIMAGPQIARAIGLIHLRGFLSLRPSMSRTVTGLSRATNN